MRYAGDVFDADKTTTNEWSSPRLNQTIFGSQQVAAYRNRNDLLKGAGAAATEAALGKYPTGYDTSSPLAAFLSNAASGFASGVSLGSKLGGGAGASSWSPSSSTAAAGFSPYIYGGYI